MRRPSSLQIFALPIFAAISLAWLALPALASPPKSQKPSSPWLGSIDQAMKLANERDAYVLVDLYADWCGWCKVLEKEVLNTPPFLEYAKNFVLLKVDTQDGGEGTMLQARFNAHSLPTTLILDKNFVKVGSISGYAPTEEFIGYIGAQMAAWKAIGENYKSVLASDDTELQRTLGEDLHERGDGSRAAALYEKVQSKVQQGSEASAWLYYLAADAHRLAGAFANARGAMKRASGMSKGMPTSSELSERLDLLSFHIAQDDGDCRLAVTSLETFLERHPQSYLRSHLSRTLTELKTDSSCTT